MSTHPSPPHPSPWPGLTRPPSKRAAASNDSLRARTRADWVAALNAAMVILGIGGQVKRGDGDFGGNALNLRGDLSGQNCTCYVPKYPLYSCNGKEYTTFCPSRRDSRGDGAWAAETARTAGEEGGPPRKSEEQLCCRKEKPRRRAAGQSQWGQARPLHGGVLRPRGGDRPDLPEGGRTLRPGPGDAGRRAESGRSHGAAPGHRAVARRLACRRSGV